MKRFKKWLLGLVLVIFVLPVALIVSGCSMILSGGTRGGGIQESTLAGNYMSETAFGQMQNEDGEDEEKYANGEDDQGEDEDQDGEDGDE